jgi:GMP synthase-like glutamine amidotransferase
MKILVFQHIASEHPGSFREVMKANGHSMHAVELDAGESIPPLAGYDVLLVMGGPMDVWEVEKHPWLVAEMAAIRDWVSAGRPYLGICLGNQLLAQAMGGQVRLMDGPPEVGISRVAVQPDPIFAGVPELCTCFQWHGAEVAILPPGGRALATSPGCRIQAFAIGEAAYGLQFHMELTATTATEWGALPEYAAALERVRGPGSLPGVQAEVAENFAPLQDAATRIFTNFLNISERALAGATL